jgi:hypothetical protein
VLCQIKNSLCINSYYKVIKQTPTEKWWTISSNGGKPREKTRLGLFLSTNHWPKADPCLTGRQAPMAENPIPAMYFLPF